jgi:hypothetical protein
VFNRVAALLALFFIPCLLVSASEFDSQVRSALEEIAPHPRLLMSEADEQRVRDEIQNHPTKESLFTLIQKHADEILDLEPVERKVTGKRLLSVSREALRRILNLSMTYRMTRNTAYAQRAIVEMETIIQFSDWNPSHFLDVAEMTAALAIGYDWLLPLLTPEQETEIRNAIRDKGIGPSYNGHDGWVFRNNNWNQVCHAGMVMGALAIADEENELALKVITRALEGLPSAIKSYQPDGIYPEGPSYWDYGTTFNILAIAVFESSLHTDFGLVDFPGFRETGSFPLYMTGPTGDHFTFSDCGSRNSAWPAVYWFAKRLEEPALAYADHFWLEKTLAGKSSGKNRVFPLILLWWDGQRPAVPERPLHWKGEGINPIAVHRSSWSDPGAVFLAIKAGTPAANHGHMDIGSFVLEADGKRWALDPMGRGYGDLEARGLTLWNMKQESDRWRIYRYHNSSHNTLTINNEAQLVKGKGSILRFSEDPKNAFTIIDMTEVYAGQLSKALRGFRLLPDGRVLIQDEVCAALEPAELCWAMTTPATMSDASSNTAAVLEQDNERLFMDVLSPSTTSIQYFSTEPKEEWDLETPNIRQVGFQHSLSQVQEERLAVLLTPGSCEAVRADTPALIPLEAW